MSNKMAESPQGEEVSINIPQKLQEQLITDGATITQKGKLVSLPAVYCVENILKDFFTHCTCNLTEDISLSLLAEVLDGLKIYFDFMLKDHLLYAEEKGQYDLVMSSHDGHVTNSMDINGEMSQYSHTPSAVYGYIHLLRLFVKLPMFLCKAQFPLPHIHILHQYFNTFLAYLETRSDELFTKDQYREPSRRV